MAQPLEQVALQLVAAGKGILAADESTGTVAKRFASVGIDNTEENRRAYRELLFTSDAIDKYISGVILFDETLRQSAADGTPFVELLEKRGVLAGIKVDAGAKPLAGAAGETVTEGLDGLGERIAEYHALGARFAKWRAVIAIGDGRPTDRAIEANAHALARYAALCVEGGLVPIVEPEVLMDGDHDIDACAVATTRTLRAVFAALASQGVPLEQILLKPNMVLSGLDCERKASASEIAEATIACFARVVPAAVPGIVFLSGGQSESEGTENLQAINARAAQTRAPWTLSFSYGRALQASALQAWRGKADSRQLAQRMFQVRASLNGAAARGRYSPQMEKETAIS